MAEDKKRVFSKSDFEFTQAEKKIYDKKFETKPVGYFKDAMIRFGKNKTNVVATIILFTIVFSGIFIPILSSKNAEVLEQQLAYLPPRLPILENIGIMDGTVYLDEQQVDLTTIDPATNLGVPFDMDIRLIVDGTLENNYSSCNKRDELCVGGQNQLLLDTTSTHISIVSLEKVFFTEANNPVIKIDVVSITETYNTALNVYTVYYMDEDVLGDGEIVSVEYATLVESITTSGLHQINPFDALDVTYTLSFVKLELVSDRSSSTVVLESVEVYDDTKTEPLLSDSGYELSMYERYLDDGGAGNYVRADGLMLMSSFRYKAYDAAFGDAYEIAFSNNEYDALLLEYADECVQFSDPDNPDALFFVSGAACIAASLVKSPV